jgi:hypothetical protein
MNNYNRYVNAQKAGILTKVPGFYVGYNTSAQWLIWTEISLLATYFRQAVMATHSLSQWRISAEVKGSESGTDQYSSFSAKA